MKTKVVVVDCANVNSESEFWAAYVRDVKPESSDFGRNLDAFQDALWGGPGFPDADEVRFVDTASLVPLRQGAFLLLLKKIAQGARWTRITFE